MHAVHNLSTSGIAYLLMLLALCALIWLAGRAAVEACIRVATSAEGLPLANAAYLSIAAGAGVVQILTWLLVDIHLFSFRSLLIALVLMVLIALATLKNYRNILLRPRISLDATSVAYAAGMLAFIASVGIDGFWSDNATILYIQQGWNLYRHVAADIFPHFGAFLNTPIFYTGDVVSSVFGFLSHLDHERYRVIGIYVINVLLAPAIPVGAYLVFRKFLSTLPAIVAALAFCTINLGPRVWSLRGESIGWIVGFSLILLAIDLLDRRSSEKSVPVYRFAPLVALLAFTAILTHGIFIISILFITVYYVLAILACRGRVERRRIVKLAVIAASITAIGLLAFLRTYDTGPIFEHHQQPRAGTYDAAVEFDNAWVGDPLHTGTPRVRSQPPLVPPALAMAIAADIPPLTPFLDGNDAFPLKSLPTAAISAALAIPLMIRWLIPAIPLLLLLLAYRRSGGDDAARARIFLATVAFTVYLAIIVGAVISNSRSVSVYPFAEVRRSFTYIAYFYWLAVILAGFDAVIAPVLSWLQRSRLLARALVTLRGAILRYRIADALRVVALPIVAVPIAVALWFLCSQAAYYGRPSPGQVILHDAHRFERLLGLAPASTTGAWIHLAPTFAAIEYLERHTAPGDWIYSNIISTSNDFDYLADGRYSLLEGTSMYQMYDTIKKSVRHIQRFRRFALTADPSLVQKWRPKYALLYRANQCNVLDCYGTQVYPVAFDRFKNNRAFVRVFANRLYVIYRITGVPGSAASATLTKLMRRCSSHNSPPVARIAACTKELRLVGKLDPNGFYYRARAEAALGQENAAMRDFTTDIERDPTNYGVYLAEARSLMNAGNVLEARADIHLAEGNGVYPSTLPGP